jgi:transcriptional regulator with XRE-family HTH domain
MKKPQELSPEQQALLAEIGKQIKELRITKNISYEKMAEETGVARNSYNLLEQGKINFQLITLEKILKHHSITLSQFFHDLESNKDSVK